MVRPLQQTDRVATAPQNLRGEFTSERGGVVLAPAPWQLTSQPGSKEEEDEGDCYALEVNDFLAGVKRIKTP